ncbi:hypothetical protein SH2C18_25740 [Clostridium sediminicola]|uniref:hypothetical protein n=1 Tax=Clostridium sediminicola TaxID=3114879 RepID=UPI0031F25F00
MSKNMKDLKNDYDNIEIPNELDDFINKGIMKGRNEMKKKNSKSKWFKGAASTAAVFVAFTLSVNTIPAFANSIIDIPVIGELVKIVQIDKESVTGGKITDGADVDSIDIKENGKGESIVIGISNDNIIADIAPHFDVEYNEYPYSLTFTISGARGLSAEKYFDSLKENKFVSDVYKIITMDDSMVRFNVTLNGPVKVEVQEYKDPAQIIVNLTEADQITEKIIYSVRSASYPNGEQIGIMEEMFGVESSRIIKDKDGTFLVEAGTFERIEEANEKIEEIKNNFGSEMKIYIEERNAGDIPKVISE